MRHETDPQHFTLPDLHARATSPPARSAAVPCLALLWLGLLLAGLGGLALTAVLGLRAACW